MDSAQSPGASSAGQQSSSSSSQQQQQQQQSSQTSSFFEFPSAAPGQQPYPQKSTGNTAEKSSGILVDLGDDDESDQPEGRPVPAPTKTKAHRTDTDHDDLGHGDYDSHEQAHRDSFDGLDDQQQKASFHEDQHRQRGFEGKNSGDNHGRYDDFDDGYSNIPDEFLHEEDDGGSGYRHGHGARDDYHAQEHSQKPQQQQPEHGSPAKAFSRPKMKFDLESQQHVQMEDTPQGSPAPKFTKPTAKTYDTPESISQKGSPASHFSRPNPQSYAEESYDAPQQQQSQPKSLNRNSQSFDDSSPARNFAQPASNPMLHSSYNDHQNKPAQQNRNSQDFSQVSPANSFTKPVAIPSKSYDSSQHYQQQQSPSMFSSNSFHGQESTSHQSTHFPPPPIPPPPQAGANLSSSYRSDPGNFGAPEPSHFPQHLGRSPPAGQNQAQGYGQSQPFQLSPGSNQPLYSNHREAQPTQHVDAPRDGSGLPKGWQTDSPPVPEKKSTNPFSPEIREQHPYQQPPPLPPQHQQQPSQQPLPLGRSPPSNMNMSENLRNLQEGSIGEERSYSQRSNHSAVSQGVQSDKPSAIGRPTPPSQPASQQSYHSVMSHQSQQYPQPQMQSREHRGSHSSYQESPNLEQPRYAVSNASPQSNASGYSIHGPPPAIPPKKPLEQSDRDREQQAEREQRTAAFNYQQHLKGRLANASTSPRGVTGYGPPPIATTASHLQHVPRVTSPLSVRKEDPSSFRPPPQPPQHQQFQQLRQPSDNYQHQQPQPQNQQSQQRSPQDDRKASFGRKNAAESSPKHSYQGGQSPQNSNRGSQYNGSPHGSHTTSTNPQQPYSPPRHQPQQQHQQPSAPSPPPSADYHSDSKVPSNLNTSQSGGRYFTGMHDPLTPLGDGPAPPPAPSCPPPDTPTHEQGFGHRKPPGGYLRSFMNGGIIGKGIQSTRNDDDGGTPVGFLGPTASKPIKGHARKPSDEKSRNVAPPLGPRPRGSSGNSGLGKMQRPPSAEGDDPIPPEYRPKGDKKDESTGDSGLGAGRDQHTSPAQQMQQLRRPPMNAPTGNRGYSDPAPAATQAKPRVAFPRNPTQPGPQQRSPAEVGLGGYLYTKPVGPPSSGTTNPRFPGGVITSPLSHTTSPPGSTRESTRESIMRGQWVDDTAAVAGPAPLRKEDQRPQQQQPQKHSQQIHGNFDPSSQDFTETASAFKAYTQGFQKRQDRAPTPPYLTRHDDVIDDEETNPSASPTPDIPHVGSIVQPSSVFTIPQPPKTPGVVSSEAGLMTALSELWPGLPRSHITSLLNFALYLTEDNIVAEKADRIKASGQDTAGFKEQIALLGDQRIRRWKEWVSLEDGARMRQVSIMGITQEPEQQRRQPHEPYRYEDRGYDGMQPLPPPPKLSGLGEYGTDQYHHHSSGPFSDPPRDETPSPTPTVDQVAAAPKVDLELQMPRPMPSVPAIRIDPGARRRLMDDDASTVASETPVLQKDHMDMGVPGGTPYPFPFPKRQEHDYNANRSVDTKVLQQVIASFTRAKSSSGDVVPGSDEHTAEIMADIPPFLHMAYAALDKVSTSAPLEQYIENARRVLDQKSQIRIQAYEHESMKRRQVHHNNTSALYNTGRLTYADIERMREQFEAEEAARQIDFDAEIYTLFENEFVEVAYKEVKAQLEELGGRWYEEVKGWLFNTTAADSRGTGTALEYHLLLEAIDLLNKLHVSMEEHEHWLQNLVTDRNARYLHISVAPLLQSGETVRAADAERRYWIDEQERQIRSKIERGKRITEHRQTVERIAERVIEGLRKRYGDVLEAVWTVVWQFPPSIQPTLLRKFFDENTMPLPNSGNSSDGHGGSGQNSSGSNNSFTVAPENLQVLADAVQTLGEIVALINLACEFRMGPAVRAVEAQITIQVAEEHARQNGVTAPQATVTACGKAIKLRLPAALKRVNEEMKKQSEAVVQGLVEVLERLRIGVTELARQGGRVELGGRMSRMEWREEGEKERMRWEGGSGEAWVGVGAGSQQHQGGMGSQMGGMGGMGGIGAMGMSQPQGQGGLSVSTLMGGFRRGQQTMLVSPGGYSPSGYSPATAGLSAVSATGPIPWAGGAPVQQQQSQQHQHQQPSQMQHQQSQQSQQGMGHQMQHGQGSGGGVRVGEGMGY